MDALETDTGNPGRTTRLSIVGAAMVTCIAAIVTMLQHGHVLTALSWFVLPQLAVIAIVALVARSGSVAFGVGLAMAGWLALFRAWVLTLPPDGLIWLSYVFSLPGGVLGALIAAFMVRRDQTRAAFRRPFVVGALATSLGIAANQTTLCMTLVQCVP